MDYQSRRQVQGEATRLAILDAAIRLTRQVGFDKMTIRDICTAAGVTTGAFYHHFSSKEDLVAHAFSSLDGYMEKALAPYRSEPAAQQLDRQYRAFLDKWQKSEAAKELERIQKERMALAADIIQTAEEMDRKQEVQPVEIG